jgi:hypothetical protein
MSNLHIPTSLTGGIAGVGGTFFAPQASTIIGSALGSLASLELQAFSSLVTFLLVIIPLIVVLFILLFKILMGLAYILVYTIFAPIAFMLGTLPGQEGAISTHLKTIVSKALFIPVAASFIYLAGFVGTAGTVTLEDLGSRNPVHNIIPPNLATYLLAPLLALIFVIVAAGSQGIIDNALGVGAKKKK